MSSPEPDPEPWLRGPLAGVPPHVMPVFFSYRQVREDLRRHLSPLNEAAIWQPRGRASIGFHLKHLAGSVDRITTYLMGEELSPAQLAALGTEHAGGESAAALLAVIDRALTDSEERLLRLNPASLFDARTVGRRRLPTTVIGLLVHLAEHTQRHLGQIITLCGIVPAG